MLCVCVYACVCKTKKFLYSEQYFVNALRFRETVAIILREYHRKVDLYNLKFIAFLGMEMNQVTEANSSPAQNVCIPWVLKWVERR